MRVSAALRLTPSCLPSALCQTGDAVAIAHRWGTASALGTGSTRVSASTEEEQGLSGVSSYRAVLGKYCNLHIMYLYLFVLSGINYALQMVMKSFVARLHKDKISPTGGDAKYCPGSAEAPVLARLGLAERARQPSGRSSSSSTHLRELREPLVWPGQSLPWRNLCTILDSDLFLPMSA